MTGPEHYLAAEQLLTAADAARERLGELLASPPLRRTAQSAASADAVLDLLEQPLASLALTVAHAQAHATLAHAAATAEQLADRYVGDGEHINEWLRAVRA